MNNITQKTVKELSALGFNLLAFSSNGSAFVQSFIAKYKGVKVHAWFSVVKDAYEFTITK